MAKIPFTLDAWLKDKSQRVETRDGCHIVETISIDLTRDNMRVMANFGNNRIVHYYDDGRFWKNANSDNDLFIITPEPELSKFEKAVEDLCWKVGIGEYVYTDDIIKKKAAELLVLARKELEKEWPSIIQAQSFNAGLKQGKAEALKDLPRWRKWGNGACGNGQGIPLAIVKRGLNGYKLEDALCIPGEQYIMLSDLEKLPGLKED